MEDKKLIIVQKRYHVEVFEDNQFIFSADTVDEAINIIKEEYNMANYIIE